MWRQQGNHEWKQLLRNLFRTIQRSFSLVDFWTRWMQFCGGDTSLCVSKIWLSVSVYFQIRNKPIHIGVKAKKIILNAFPSLNQGYWLDWVIRTFWKLICTAATDVPYSWFGRDISFVIVFEWMNIKVFVYAHTFWNLDYNPKQTHPLFLTGACLFGISVSMWICFVFAFVYLES